MGRFILGCVGLIGGVTGNENMASDQCPKGKF